jgi:hypothetical protein
MPLQKRSIPVLPERLLLPSPGAAELVGKLEEPLLTDRVASVVSPLAFRDEQLPAKLLALSVGTRRSLSLDRQSLPQRRLVDSLVPSDLSERQFARFLPPSPPEACFVESESFRLTDGFVEVVGAVEEVFALLQC